MSTNDTSVPKHLAIGDIEIPIHAVHTLIIGSGCAALKAANRLHQGGIEDVVIVTESLKGGTSYNTGSDKQTYYRLSTSGKEPDSPYLMARDLVDGGCMHGDLALVESIGSTASFHYLASIGVPFPVNRYGGYTGYKTDHDSRERGCSIGPYTSKRMVEALLCEVERRGMLIHEQTEVVKLLSTGERVVGAIAIDRKRLTEDHYGLMLYMADNVVFATGGPGGLYEDSVYPSCHSGAIGLALEIGAEANNLSESQFGLASIKFRWNVSGSYQQVIPAYVSTDKDGHDEREFLQPFFDTTKSLCHAIFLKGYQWPFDVKKMVDHGSSLIDILVYRERVLLGRRVFMDFRRNPSSVAGDVPFSLDAVGPVARTYLEKSEAWADTPYERLTKMNPQAIELYRTHGIDLATEPLEVAVCAQHNNGGLSVDLWWESVNIAHLFPIGEVAGTHGVARPGGSALNSGQVGAERAASKIAGSYRQVSVSYKQFLRVAESESARLYDLIDRSINRGEDEQKAMISALQSFRLSYRKRMSKAGAMVRDGATVEAEVKEAWQQVASLDDVPIASRYLIPKWLQSRHLVFAHAVYLDAIASYLRLGGGSRGSAVVLDKDGQHIHPRLEDFWHYQKEHTPLRSSIMTTRYGDGKCEHALVACRSIPNEEFWFETVWRDYLDESYLQS